MSSRPQLNPQPVIINGDMSGDLTSLVTIIQKISKISYTCDWNGSSPVGEIIVEVSNDYSQNADGSVKNAGSWEQLPLSATASVTGNTGIGAIDIESSFYAIRLKYIRTSGTGTLNVTIVGKVM